MIAAQKRTELHARETEKMSRELAGEEYDTRALEEREGEEEEKANQRERDEEEEEEEEEENDILE